MLRNMFQCAQFTSNDWWQPECEWPPAVEEEGSGSQSIPTLAADGTVGLRLASIAYSIELSWQSCFDEIKHELHLFNASLCDKLYSCLQSQFDVCFDEGGIGDAEQIHPQIYVEEDPKCHDAVLNLSELKFCLAISR